MFKWIVIVIGLFFLWGGIDNHLNYSDSINEDAIEVSFPELEKLIQGKEKKFITYRAGLDEAGRIYPSYLEQPPYAAYSPVEPQEIPLEKLANPQILEKFLGAQVDIQSAVQGSFVELQYIHKEGSERNLTATAVLAPLNGSGLRVWVLSPWFRSGEENKKVDWLRQQSFTGRLTKLSDLNENFDSLDKSVNDIRNRYSESSGQVIPFDALVVLSNRTKMVDSDASRVKYYALVEETDLLLYVETNDEQLAAIEATGVITGILKPVESRYYRDFARVLGESEFPQRIGIVSQESAKTVNEENLRATLIGVIGGLCFLALGGFLVLRSSKRAA